MCWWFYDSYGVIFLLILRRRKYLWIVKFKETSFIQIYILEFFAISRLFGHYNTILRVNVHWQKASQKQLHDLQGFLDCFLFWIRKNTYKVKATYEIRNNVLYTLYISIWRGSFCLVLWLVSVTVNKTKFFILFSKHNFHKARKFFRSQQRIGTLNGMTVQPTDTTDDPYLECFHRWDHCLAPL